MLVVTNLNLFAASFSNLFDTKITPIQDVQKADAYESNNIASLIGKNPDSPEVQALIQKYQGSGVASQSVSSDTENALRAKLKDYPFNFNTLPPVNKILIPVLGLDVPIIEPKSMSAKDFITANFDAELMSGVVKYPTTPDPGTSGNSLIF